MIRFFSILLLFVFVRADDATQESLLCKKWRQVGLKPFNKIYRPVDDCRAEEIEFKCDGSYSKTLYCTMNVGGQWRFNSDSTKLSIAITEMNGQHVENAMGIEQSKPNTLILFLSPDSLILGNEGYFGPEKKYGHDNSYYVAAKK